MYDLSLTDYGILYLAVTLAAAAMLTLAYKNVDQSTGVFLSSTRKTGAYNKAGDSASLMGQESLAWSLFLNNAIFVGLFLFLAFYALRSVDTL